MSQLSRPQAEGIIVAAGGVYGYRHTVYTFSPALPRAVILQANPLRHWFKIVAISGQTYIGLDSFVNTSNGFPLAGTLVFEARMPLEGVLCQAQLWGWNAASGIIDIWEGFVL